MLNKYLKPTLNSQGGYASFVITLITIAVVSLIVVAFASDARVEQKDSLANNLATQAYYAAESGINDAKTVVDTYIANGATPPSTGNSCANPVSSSVYINSAASNQLSSNVQYTCLMVNPKPTSLAYQPVNPGEAEVIPITTSTTLDDITVNWQSASTGTAKFTGCPQDKNPAGAATLPVSSSYTNCSAGVIQLDLISSGSLSSELGSNPYASKANTVFLEPTCTSAACTRAIRGQSNKVSKNDQVFYVSCSASVPSGYDCSYTLNLTILPNQSDTYYLHLQDFYVISDVSISATDTTGGPAPISGAQLEIDSTGEAGGQLKRIAEWVCDNAYCGSSGNNSLSSAAAIESTECIKKDFAVYDGYNNTTPADGSGASCP